MIKIIVGKTKVPEKLLNRTVKPKADIEKSEHGTASICTSCERSVRGSCSWRQESEPYPGWDATEKIVMYAGEPKPTYIVHSCPGFQNSFELVQIVERVSRKKTVATELYVRRWPLRAKDLDDNGCIDLMAAVIKSARVDYLIAPVLTENEKHTYTSEDKVKAKARQRRDIEAFLRRSAWLTNPEWVIKQLKDQARIVDLHPEKRQQIIAGLSDEEWEKQQKQKKPTSNWVLYNSGTDMAFAECAHCGYEQELAEKFPKKCPFCKSIMTKVVKADD